MSCSLLVFYSAPSSRTIATPADAPMRLAPASSIVRTSARVRMPPEAFTPQRPPATPRSSATSARGCAAAGEARRGLQEIGPGLDGDLGSAQFLLHRQQASLKDHFKNGAMMVGNGGRRMDGMFHGVMVAALELADGEDHVEFAGAQPGERGGLVAQTRRPARLRVEIREPLPRGRRCRPAAKQPWEPTPGSPWRRRNGSEWPHRRGSPPVRGWRRVSAGCGHDTGKSLPARQGLRSKSSGIKCSVVKIKVFLHGRNRSHGHAPSSCLRRSFGGFFVSRGMSIVPVDELTKGPPHKSNADAGTPQITF